MKDEPLWDSAHPHCLFHLDFDVELVFNHVICQKYRALKRCDVTKENNPHANVEMVSS